MLSVTRLQQCTLLQLRCDEAGCRQRSPPVQAPYDPERWMDLLARAATPVGWRFLRVLGAETVRCPRHSGFQPAGAVQIGFQTAGDVS